MSQQEINAPVPEGMQVLFPPVSYSTMFTDFNPNDPEELKAFEEELIQVGHQGYKLAATIPLQSGRCKVYLQREYTLVPKQQNGGLVKAQVLPPGMTPSGRMNKGRRPHRG